MNYLPNYINLVFVILMVSSMIIELNCENTAKSKTQRVSRRRSSPVRRDGVVPDVIDTVPKSKITIKYPGDLEVKFGNELTPTQVKNQPTVDWPADKDSLYTLAMVDPDAPTRTDPIYGQYKHWLVVNIPGADVAKGQTLADYKGSGPPKDTGLHRYIFLVYKQPANTNSTDTSGRPFFKVRDYAQGNNLGEPIAINYFQAKFDGSLG